LVVVAVVEEFLPAVLVVAFLPGILFHMPLAGPFLTCRLHLMPTRQVLYQLAVCLLVLPVVAVEVQLFVQNQLPLM
jgi:hypothetical protein